jgi:hypothetical protein
MSHRGIQLQFVFEENENDQLSVAGGGVGHGLTLERKLYYREMVARFAHHQALIWVIGDESNYWDEYATMEALASEIRALDPYRHPIAFHSKHPCIGCPEAYPTIIEQYSPYFWFDSFEATAYQTVPNGYNISTVLLCSGQASTRKWAHYGDEQSLYALPSNLDENRRKTLWGNLMGGGAGVAWYPGFNDLNQYPPGTSLCDYFDIAVEDFRLFENYFLQTKIAIDIFQEELPFLEMTANNGLASPSPQGNYVFHRPEDPGQGIKAIYAVYRGTGSECNLTIGPGEHSVEWHNPRSEGEPLAGPALLGPGEVQLAPPEQDPGMDWLAIVRQQ